MSLVKQLVALTKMKVFSLVVVLIAASTLLILINYFTIRITSAVRSYINGESQYSKGQKDATRNLILYLNTKDTVYWNAFKRELQVPIGDSLARIELMKDGDEEVIKKGFLQGRNKAEDVPELIWLFRNFKDVPFFKRAIAIWKEGDHMIGQASLIGNIVHKKLTEGQLSSTDRTELIARINTNTTKLTELEVKFSETLGASARKINSYLFYANLSMTILVVFSASAYATVMIRKLRKSNLNLIRTNRELDKFVYSASHDLKAPIASIKGLIDLANREQDSAAIKGYLKMMMDNLMKQEKFIKEIINISRNKTTHIHMEPVDLDKIIDQAIAQLHYMPEAATIEIDKEITLNTIQSDRLRIEIIVNNILSNAIKYSDPTKDKQQISIRISLKGNHCFMEFIDNGIGIDKANLSRVFELFFVADIDHKGSGLGLYIVKETVDKLKGTIKVESERGLGTKFVITLPYVS